MDVALRSLSINELLYCEKNQAADVSDSTDFPALFLQIFMGDAYFAPPIIISYSVFPVRRRFHEINYKRDRNKTRDNVAYRLWKLYARESEKSWQNDQHRHKYRAWT